MRLKNTATSNKKKRKRLVSNQKEALVSVILFCAVSESESAKTTECGEAGEAISTRLANRFADVFPEQSHN